VALLQLDQAEFVLVIVMHHIVADGWSKDIFRQELVTLYDAFHAGHKAPPLPELALQYADFAWWQNEQLRQEGLAKQLAYWQQKLADSPPLLALPTDRPRLSRPTYQGGHVTHSLPTELGQALKSLSQQQGVTLFMLLLAAFKILLYRYTQQTDILVGTPIANRRYTAVEGLIGFFVNTLVLRSDLAGNPTFEQFLQQVRNTALDAYDYQDLPFEQLVEALQPERNLSQTPLFQVMFLLVNAPKAALSLADLTLKPFPFGGGPTKFDLTLAAMETETSFVVTFEYNHDLFEAATVERMAGHFVTLLESIVAEPQRPLANLPLLTPAEQKQLTPLSQVPEPDIPLIPTLFEAQAAALPEATAVLFGQTSLTYRQLNEQANQLAHHLQSQGVITGTVVGVCLERSLELVIALLATLKAGGTILPLDPAYPAERLAFMLSDAQAALVITTTGFIDSQGLPVAT
jgi:non-ribosomal peptide synthetase component F